MKLTNKGLYHINFKGNIGTEINDIHLGIIYKLPVIKNMVFCIPLTSPKPKHFKTLNDYKTRNYLNVVHFNWQYIKQTDSIALLDQIRMVSVSRIISPYKNQDFKEVVLTDETNSLVLMKLKQYINKFLK